MTQNNDLRNRIIFTILILAVYRFGTFVPLPGIDPDQLRKNLDKNVLKIFDVNNSMNSKKSYGGTSAANVKAMIKKYKKEVK